jgi:hypothetical protein
MSALDTSVELGEIRENELRELHERIADAHGLMLDGRILERALAFMAKLEPRELVD